MLFGPDRPPIILDNGTGMLKIGYAGEMQPRALVPTILGLPKKKSLHFKETSILQMEPNLFNTKQSSLSLTYPMVNGIIDNWKDMEILWHHLFDQELQIDPKNHPLMITEVPLNPKYHRENIAQVMFEKFQVPALQICTPNILSLYASGRTTGLILDCGEGVTSLVPIYDAFVIPLGVCRQNLAGLDLTNYLKILLNQKGYNFLTTCEHEVARDIKETTCYIPLDYNNELKLNKNSHNCLTQYLLPDGNHIQIINERFQTPELVFNPKLASYEYKSVHQAVYESISMCEIDIRKNIWSNIILTGGGTMFPGFVERLQFELDRLAPNGAKVKLHATPERKYTAWIGGAVLASLSTYEKMWVMKTDYEEYGTQSIHQKCV